MAGNPARILLGALLLGVLSPAVAAAQSVGCTASALTNADPGFNSPTYDMQVYRPAVDARGYFSINAARVLRHLEMSLQVGGTWAVQPLVIRAEAAPPCTPFTRTRTFSVDHLVTPSLTFALGLFSRYQVGFTVPVGIVAGKRQLCEPGPDGQEVCHGFDAGGNGRDDLSYLLAGVGDLALHFKAHAVREQQRFPLDLSVLLSLSIPISALTPAGNLQNAFLGERLPTLRPQIILERGWGRSRRLYTAFNLGAVVRFGQETFTDTGAPDVIGGGRQFCYPVDDYTKGGFCGTGKSRTLASQLTYGVGAALAVWPGRLELLGEIYGYADFAGNYHGYPVEGGGGVRLHLTPRAYLTFGAGAGVYGLGSGVQTGASAWRTFGGLTFLPSFGGPSTSTTVIRERQVNAPDKDSDGDGLMDRVDRCPLEPEDKDGFEDQDGCPDRDNDRDGVPDEQDRCPLEPEDADGFEDRDGCPDLDNDADGIPDVRDRCPLQAEDRDSFEDEDGCPDLDNDKDGVLDPDDGCVNQPGPAENKGCPDQDQDKDGLVDRQDKCPEEPGPPPLGCPERRYILVTGDKIELKQQIHFATRRAKINPDSYDLLNEVVEVLKNRPAVHMRIEGHTDNKGKPKFNQTLSEKRAAAVRDYLVKQGIDPARLSSEGFGQDRPVADNKTEEGREKNRRTEFYIVKPGSPAQDKEISR
jgi:outer membrane protein OmpA-like peptidoglycan-associated protein